MIQPADKSKYDINRRSGFSKLHKELEWYVNGDETVLGVVVRDKVDNDFSWVVLMESDQAPGFSAIDLDASIPTLEKAREILHATMEKYTIWVARQKLFRGKILQ